MYAEDTQTGRNYFMNEYLLTCRSLTYAQRSQKLLIRNGYKASLMRTPAEASREGCGYSVRLRGAKLTAALALLDGAGLTPRRVYVIKGGGRLEEIAI